MRILQVVHDFLPHHTGGSELYAFYLSQELARRHEVDVLFTGFDRQRPQYTRATFEYEGLRCHEVVHNHLSSGFQDTYADPRMDAIFQRLLDDFRPELIHIHHLLNHSINYVDIAAHRGIPVVFTLHDYWLSCARMGQRLRHNGHVCETLDVDACGSCLKDANGLTAVGRRIAAAGVRVIQLTAAVAGPRTERPRTADWTTCPVTIDGETRDAVVLNPPAAVPLTCGSEGLCALRFGLAVEWTSDTAALRCAIHGDGNLIWTRELAPTSRLQWIDFRVALRRPPGSAPLQLTVEPRSGRVSAVYCSTPVTETQGAESTRSFAAAKRLVQSAARAWPSQLAEPSPSQVAARLRHILDCCRNVDLFLAPSVFLRDRLLEFGLPDERIVYLPLGIPHRITAEARTPQRPMRVGYIGVLAPHKGVHILIEAFKQAARRSPGCASLFLHGSGMWFSDYARRLRADAEGCNVQFCGEFRPSDANALYRSLDLLVVPSLWWENAPLTIREAALAGIPVLGSNLGGTAESIRHFGNGLLFEAGSATDLADRLLALIDDETLWSRLAHGTVAPPTIEEHARAIERHYAELSRRDLTRTAQRLAIGGPL
jgi:glycosyltransferase involved in cell wall biosynthesis